MTLLDDAALEAALAHLPAWKRADRAIHAEYRFPDFPAAIAFVNRVAELAEAAWHHPDIDIRWNRVLLTLTTHDEGGVTEKDIALAQHIHEAASV